MTRGALCVLVTCITVGVPGCAPRLQPLGGTVAPATFPRAELPRGQHRILFRWEMEDGDMLTRGDGAARVASPDSVRLDFFLAGGLGGGAAVLIGAELRLPPTADDFARRLIPPAPLLWAALGRLAVPPSRDTTARVDGDTLRADIGAPAVWRVTFIRDTLRRLERVTDGRVVEWVDRRGSDNRVRYQLEPNRRRLDLFISRSEPSAFDQTIFVFP
jgi:hypothetical protein